MEIKKIKEESYESVQKYIEAMLKVVTTLDNLCFVDTDDKRYMVTMNGDMCGIVENNNGELIPHYFYLGNRSSEKDVYQENFGDSVYGYEFVTSGDIKSIYRKKNTTDDCERLSYAPKVENDPVDYIEYMQFLDSSISALTKRYDISGTMDSLNYDLMYCGYHNPDYLRLDVLHRILLIYRKKSFEFLLDKDDIYKVPLIRFANTCFLTKKTPYDPNELLEGIYEMGFSKSIPYELSSVLAGNSETYKSLKLVSNSYGDYLKGQK